MRDPSWMQPAAGTRKAPTAPAPAADVIPAEEDTPYLAAWLSYKRRWREIWLSMLGWGVIAALVAVLPRWKTGELVLSVLFPIWALIWFITTTINALRIVGFSCPRCGGSYFTFGKPIMSQLKCQSCGLRKFHVNDRGTPLYRLRRPT